ncbi:hypothetical protein NIES4074_57810 [Cylindrospermum sp. NIES-4074]|nr:hypothetical protein NIES4074_57810 [Cylindrospermum sp. NIES-4074]
MANIKVNDIQPAGLELFADAENFMHQLTDDEITGIVGGLPKDVYPLYDKNTVIISYIYVPK